MTYSTLVRLNYQLCVVILMIDRIVGFATVTCPGTALRQRQEMMDPAPASCPKDLHTYIIYF